MDSTSMAIARSVANENIAWITLLVVILLLSLTTVIVGLRIFTRIVLIKQLGWDDYCVIVTLIAALVDGAVILSTIPFGLGRHTATLAASDIPLYLRNFFFSIVFYNITLTLTKLTFMIQYYRVLSVHKMKKVIWILGSIIMLWSLTQLLTTIFSCHPVQKYWEADLPGYCMPDLPFWYINAAGNIITDLAIFVIPLPVLGRLQLHKKQKYFIMGIFSLGFFTCAISLIRLAYLKQGSDFTFDNVPTSCWSIAEAACGITCACLPTLRPLMARIKPSWMTSSNRRTRQRGYGKNQYGNNTSVHGVDAKGASGQQTRNTRNSIHTLSTMNKTYSRLKDNEIELAMGEPMPPSHSYGGGLKRSDTVLSRNSVTTFINGTEEDGFQLQQLQPRPKQDDKTQEVLGLGRAGMGVTAHVVAGNRTSFSPSHKADVSMTGIEVKRQVTVTTTEG